MITTVYTEQFGLLKFIIPGVRKSKSRISAGLLQPMSMVDLVIYMKEKKDLLRVKEVRPDYLFQKLPFNVIRSSIGLFMIEVAQKTIREEEANPELYDFLTQSFKELDSIEDGLANIHLVFMVQLSRFLGFAPFGESRQFPYFDLREGTFINKEPGHPHWLDEEDSLLLRNCMRCSYQQLGELPFQREQRRRLLDKLVLYYKLHMEQLKEINAHEVLKTVLA